MTNGLRKVDVLDIIASETRLELEILRVRVQTTSPSSFSHESAFTFSVGQDVGHMPARRDLFAQNHHHEFGPRLSSGRWARIRQGSRRCPRDRTYWRSGRVVAWVVHGSPAAGLLRRHDNLVLVNGSKPGDYGHAELVQEMMSNNTLDIVVERRRPDETGANPRQRRADLGEALGPPRRVQVHPQ